MRIPIYESKLVKTIRFEPEELEKIELVTKTQEREAMEDREDLPSESEVIRMLVRLGLEFLLQPKGLRRKETLKICDSCNSLCVAGVFRSGNPL